VVERCGSEALLGRFERVQPGELVGEDDGRRLLAGGGNLSAQLRLAIRVGVDRLILRQLGDELGNAQAELLLQFCACDGRVLENVMQKSRRDGLVIRALASQQPGYGDRMIDSRLAATALAFVRGEGEAIRALEEI
jgi:hypothetical protein